MPSSGWGAGRTVAPVAAVQPVTDKKLLKKVVTPYVPPPLSTAMLRFAIISALATDASFTQQEAEAVLAHTRPSEQYEKNTLLALQTLNRYAAAKGIRVEDAITVIQDWVPGVEKLYQKEKHIQKLGDALKRTLEREKNLSVIVQGLTAKVAAALDVAASLQAALE